MKTIPVKGGHLAIVDDHDYEVLSRYSWYLAHGYPSRQQRIAKGKQRQVRMHRQIMNEPPGMDIDHANRNKLDNRRANLRVCTRAENLRNIRRITNKSGYHGVSWKANNGKWCAQIQYGRVIHIGLFTDLDEAAYMYDQFAAQLFGEFAALNHEVSYV